MGYARRKLKPVNEKSHAAVLVPCAIVAIGGVAFFLIHGGSVIGQNDHNIEESRERGRVTAGENLILNRELMIGDFSDLRDKSFCNRYGLDGAKVYKKYDTDRCADTYICKTIIKSPKRISGVWLKTMSQNVECENKIVEQGVVTVMTPEHDKGTIEFDREIVAIAAAVVDEVADFAALSEAGNRVVASSPNIRYRGRDRARMEEAMCNASRDAIENSGIASIQWKTAKGFVAWNFLWRRGVYTTMVLMSDREIRAEVFGNE